MSPANVSRSVATCCAISMLIGSSPSTESKAVRLDARGLELDLEGPLCDRAFLADQLIRALFVERSGSIGGDVVTRCVAHRFAVEKDAERHRFTAGGRPHHEVHVARVKAERDPAAGPVQRRSRATNGPVA